MSFPNQLPYGVFSGALGDNATGGYYPARVEVSNGLVTMWIGSPAGWNQHFSVHAPEVTVKSAAQRITLVVRGQSYPILADPNAVNRALGYTATGIAASALNMPAVGIGSDVARGINQVGAANAWNAGGGPQFIQAAQTSGARVSRLGYGGIAAIGCGAALALVLVFLVIGVVAVGL